MTGFSFVGLRGVDGFQNVDRPVRQGGILREVLVVVGRGFIHQGVVAQHERLVRRRSER